MATMSAGRVGEDAGERGPASDIEVAPETIAAAIRAAPVKWEILPGTAIGGYRGAVPTAINTAAIDRAVDPPSTSNVTKPKYATGTLGGKLVADTSLVGDRSIALQWLVRLATIG